MLACNRSHLAAVMPTRIAVLGLACSLAISACANDPVTVSENSAVTTSTNELPTATDIAPTSTAPTSAPTAAPTTVLTNILTTAPTSPAITATIPADPVDPALVTVAEPLDASTTPGGEENDTSVMLATDLSANLDPAITIRSNIPTQLTSPAGAVLGRIQAFAIVNNAERFQLACCDEANTASGTIPVSARGRFTITIEWQERYLGQILPLVSTSRVVQVSRGATTVNLLESSYTLSGDVDGDGVLNLTERFEGSNPFDANDALLVNLPPNVDVVISRFPDGTSPVIDGLLNRTNDPVLPANDSNENFLQSLGEEWQNATTMDRFGQALTISRVLAERVTNSTSSEPSHRWAVGHDGEYLYILVVSDDAGLHEFDSDDNDKRWKDDDLEIYLDGDNSRLAMYDGINDVNYHVNLIGDSDLAAMPIANSSSNSGHRTGVGPNSVALPDNPDDFVFEIGLLAGPISTAPERGSTDIYEIRISLDALEIQTGRSFGIDLHVNDDDNGDDRDNKWSWAHPIGNGIELDTTWINPSLMGTGWLQP